MKKVCITTAIFLQFFASLYAQTITGVTLGYSGQDSITFHVSSNLPSTHDSLIATLYNLTTSTTVFPNKYIFIEGPGLNITSIGSGGLPAGNQFVLFVKFPGDQYYTQANGATQDPVGITETIESVDQQLVQVINGLAQVVLDEVKLCEVKEKLAYSSKGLYIAKWIGGTRIETRRFVL